MNYENYLIIIFLLIEIVNAIPIVNKPDEV